jgi:hypothetical protein
LIDFPRCAFPPLLMTLMKPLSRVLAVVVGRSARIWWQRQTDYKHDIPRNIMVDLFRCAFPPLLMTLMKPLSRVLAVVVGRSARIWWQRLPSHKRTTSMKSLDIYWLICLDAPFPRC